MINFTSIQSRAGSTTYVQTRQITPAAMSPA